MSKKKIPQAPVITATTGNSEIEDAGLDVLSRIAKLEQDRKNNEATALLASKLESEFRELKGSMTELQAENKQLRTALDEKDEIIGDLQAEISLLRSALEGNMDKSSYVVTNPLWCEKAKNAPRKEEPLRPASKSTSAVADDPRELEKCRRSRTFSGAFILLMEGKLATFTNAQEVKSAQAKLKREDYPSSKLKQLVCSWLNDVAKVTSTEPHIMEVAMLQTNKFLVVCSTEEAMQLLEKVCLEEFALWAASLPASMPVADRNAFKLYIDPALTPTQKAIRAALIPTFRELKDNLEKYNMVAVRMINEQLMIKMAGSNQFVPYSGGRGYVHPDTPGVMREGFPPIFRPSGRSSVPLDDRLKEANLRKGTTMDMSAALNMK
jgi:hypothetical protein